MDSLCGGGRRGGDGSIFRGQLPVFYRQHSVVPTRCPVLGILGLAPDRVWLAIEQREIANEDNTLRCCCGQNRSVPCVCQLAMEFGIFG